MANGSSENPLLVLREYQRFAPWNLRDLTAVTGALLEASGVRPTNAAAKAKLSDRTIRYYVTRGIVSPPDGRGTSATYSYRHLLQVLSIKLRQMEGAALSRIAAELEEQTGDVIERRVAAALGDSLSPPSLLPLRNPEAVRGRAGQAIHSWTQSPTPETGAADPGHAPAATKWHRITVVRGMELHVHEDHPMAKHVGRAEAIADAVRLAVNRILMSGD
ncbi:MAG: MerR family transcriptional regulator [Gemmatimonadetes bacterium]|nr:MerR family transcriptional regulator [Gemmatimonadota bacterium]